LPPVEILEVLERHVHLAARLQHARRLVPEPLRYGAHGAEVLGHILAERAVAPRGAACEPPVLVTQRDSEAVDLQLRDVAGLLIGAEEASYARVPLFKVFGLAGVG
jgi:hypothetical protein